MKENCYKGLFWDLETETFQRWKNKKCRKESQETFQEETKNI
jgi:hypothetical protein